MVHPRSLLDGLACAFHRLSRMALQPQRSCQDGTRQIPALEAEMDRRGPPRARLTTYRRLKLRTGSGEVAAKMQWNPQNGMGQLRCDCIVHGSGDGGAAL